MNAFNPLKNWYDTDVIGIDTGIILLMAENLRTGFVWDTFMKTRGSAARNAASRAQEVLALYRARSVLDWFSRPTQP